MKKIRKNDEVIIIAGSNKGKSGKVVRIDWKANKVVVDKINVVKKHVKPSQTNPEGGIQEFEAPISISNVALKGKGKDESAIKVGFKVEDGKKTRVNKKTGKAL